MFGLGQYTWVENLATRNQPKLQKKKKNKEKFRNQPNMNLQETYLRHHVGLGWVH
jgi:hypothetical protein